MPDRWGQQESGGGGGGGGMTLEHAAEAWVSGAPNPALNLAPSVLTQITFPEANLEVPATAQEWLLRDSGWLKILRPGLYWVGADLNIGGQAGVTFNLEYRCTGASDGGGMFNEQSTNLLIPPDGWYGTIGTVFAVSQLSIDEDASWLDYYLKHDTANPVPVFQKGYCIRPLAVQSP